MQTPALTYSRCSVSNDHPLAAILAHPATCLLTTDVHALLAALLLLLRLLGIHNPLLDVARQREEGVLDIDVGLGRNLHEWDAELVRERLALFGGDGALLFPVAFVTDEDLVHAFGCVLLDV